MEEEADFYGAMDGASKFVRGDAIAAILITLINIVGGFAIGVLQKGMTMGEALQRFTILSIGDGLVSQIPALITSTAAGVLITRATSKNDLGRELSRQLLFYPRALTLLSGHDDCPRAGAGIAHDAVPHARGDRGDAFLQPHRHGLGDLAPAAASAPGGKAGAKAGQTKPGAAGSATAAEARATDQLENLLTLDRSKLNSATGWCLWPTRRRAGISSNASRASPQFRAGHGRSDPADSIARQSSTGANEYRFLLKGQPIAHGGCPGHWLAMNATNSKVALKGIPTVEPVFQLPATWVTDVERRAAETAAIPWWMRHRCS